MEPYGDAEALRASLGRASGRVRGAFEPPPHKIRHSRGRKKYSGYTAANVTFCLNLEILVGRVGLEPTTR